MAATISAGERKLYTRREVAHALGASISTIDRLIAEGRLRSVVVAKRATRIPASSLCAYLQEIGAESALADS